MSKITILLTLTIEMLEQLAVRKRLKRDIFPNTAIPGTLLFPMMLSIGTFSLLLLAALVGAELGEDRGICNWRRTLLDQVPLKHKSCVETLEQQPTLSTSAPSGRVQVQPDRVTSDVVEMPAVKIRVEPLNHLESIEATTDGNGPPLKEPISIASPIVHVGDEVNPSMTSSSTIAGVAEATSSALSANDLQPTPSSTIAVSSAIPTVSTSSAALTFVQPTVTSMEETETTPLLTVQSSENLLVADEQSAEIVTLSPSIIFDATRIETPPIVSIQSTSSLDSTVITSTIVSTASPTALTTLPLPNTTPDSERVLKHPKERFNFASFDCGAVVMSTNKGAKSATSILQESKDQYLLNVCEAPEKFVVVELCEEILVDTVVLANYEFFSSAMRTFRVSVSNRYPPKKDWTPIGTFEAKNSRDAQVGWGS